ncbi:three component ABC system middle component [Jiangella alba]|uniref:Uncharacterized protein n=2 Tax=Jiangella alba TaxID=561176 RepID=A0A1H5J6N7_9ACTN|nr:three component ABC system middle component [Jiangella alba]SEE48132.1 hypothetical protein SAMN04488561_1461 [Jiangella alba]
MTRRGSRHEAPEVSSLLNPALIALVLHRGSTTHRDENGAGLPFVYAPIVSAVSLYPAARATLTMSVATQFTTWIDRNPDIQLLLQPRIAGVVPFVREGLLFALTTDVLRLDSGALIPGAHGPTKTIRGASSDMEAVQRTAAYMGRWLARTGNVSTVCAMLGVTP